MSNYCEKHKKAHTWMMSSSFCGECEEDVNKKPEENKGEANQGFEHIYPTNRDKSKVDPRDGWIDLGNGWEMIGEELFKKGRAK